MGNYRIVLADDHVIFRQGMIRLIDEEPGLEVVGEANDGMELLNLIEELLPDLAILDISMPGVGGIGITREIKKRFSDLKVLILTMHKNTEYLYVAVSAGAHGYLLKEDSDIELFTAIETIRAGGNYVSGNLTGDIAGDLTSIIKGNGKFPFEPLTKREKQVLQLVVQGKSNKEIGDILFISVRTVENHRFKVMKKLKASNTADLVKCAIHQGLTD